MIFDKLDHIETYKGLSDDLFLGLEFLKNATPDIENGVHEINPRVKAIVSEYETRKVNEKVDVYQKIALAKNIYIQ